MVSTVIDLGEETMITASESNVFANDNKPPFSKTEIKLMAHIISERHGPQAFNVATHFKTEHEALGDTIRAAAWNRVAQYLFENTTLS